jgi:hypothetical protein
MPTQSLEPMEGRSHVTRDAEGGKRITQASKIVQVEGFANSCGKSDGRGGKECQET